MATPLDSLGIVHETDVLILGAGASGCGAALSASRHGLRVLLADKGKLESCGSLGGGNDHFMAVLNTDAPGDTTETIVDFYCTPTSGYSPSQVRQWVEAMPQMIEVLKSLGIEFLHNADGSFYRTTGFGQPGSWWTHINNGKYIKRRLAGLIRSQGVDVLEYVQCTKILVQDGKAIGAAGFHVLDGTFHIIRAKIVISALGRLNGRVSVNSSLNPFNSAFSPFITGSQIALPYEAGAQIITLDTEQQVSYTMRYTADAITIQFHYTNSLPDSMTLSKNPLFSAANFSGDTLTLPLRNRGIFMGCAPSYQNGKLVLRFNNPPSSVSKATIVIDPGHGGNDSGALGYLAAYPEKTINYGIATELADLLEAKGADVVLLDTKYNNYSLQQRVAMATQADPHLFISVHSNSSAYSASAAGTEAYYFNYWSSGLAQFSSSNIASVLNTTNRGQKFGYYYVTRTMQYPAILIETGFVSNQTEYHKLINEDYQQEIAQAISKAVSSYLSYLYEAGSMTGTESS